MKILRLTAMENVNSVRLTAEMDIPWDDITNAESPKDFLLVETERLVRELAFIKSQTESSAATSPPVSPESAPQRKE